MSLRMRLMLAFALVVFLCLSIAALVVAILLQDSRDDTQLSRLEDTARPIHVQFRSLLSGQLKLAEVGPYLQEQAQSSNIYIILVDGSGNIVREIAPRRNLPLLNITSGTLPHGGAEQQSGTFETANGVKFLYIAYPLDESIREFTLAGQRLDSLIVAKARSNVITIWASLIRPFFWAAVISLIISVVLAIFLARSIYRPVQKLAKAAESVATGKYDEIMPAEGPRELKELAVSFNNMSAKVKESQQQLRHFVADVSHQLKSPLTSIQGFAQALLDGTANDKETRDKAARIIVDESRRMIRQVNELLELSRLQAGQVKLASEHVDVAELLFHCLEIFNLRMQEKNICLASNLEPLMSVTGDFDRLEDVFCNLIDNAIKNTPAHGEIQVQARNANQNAEISIVDSGPGIPPEQLPYVFQRFQKDSNSSGGTGLGLAIAREIVLAHHGKIEVISNPGEGASFVVTLPLKSV